MRTFFDLYRIDLERLAERLLTGVLYSPVEDAVDAIVELGRSRNPLLTTAVRDYHRYHALIEAAQLTPARVKGHVYRVTPGVNGQAQEK